MVFGHFWIFLLNKSTNHIKTKMMGHEIVTSCISNIRPNYSVWVWKNVGIGFLTYDFFGEWIHPLQIHWYNRYCFSDFIQYSNFNGFFCAFIYNKEIKENVFYRVWCISLNNFSNFLEAFHKGIWRLKTYILY